MYVHVCVCVCVCVLNIFYKPLVRISPNLQLVHLRTDWIFEVEGQAHSKTTHGQISTLGGIFSSASGMRGCI